MGVTVDAPWKVEVERCTALQYLYSVLRRNSLETIARGLRSYSRAVIFIESGVVVEE
jgi:hypothetical protein